jgi:hypothetical protein
MNINEISRGITHIEDLGIDEFLDVLKNIKEYGITEKVDGAQILFGIDEKGFYTSRETKGGTRIYAAEDYGISFPTTYMRSAHTLLESMLSELKSAGFRSGDQVEAEVLYGELPNVVPYSADRNYLIFLRTTEGQVNIDRLKERLDGQSLSVFLMSPFTPDGRTIALREETNNWVFSRAPKISIDINSLHEEVIPHVSKMVSYLRKSSGICNQPNHIIENTPLNKVPAWCKSEDWKDIKEQIKEKKIEFQTILHEGYIADIKGILLNRLVRNKQSEFGPLVEDGGWIEGVVLRHNKTGRMVKLVDKEVFGTIRESSWAMRNQLTESAKSASGFLSFLGCLKVDMAMCLGHPELGTMQAKNYLKKAGTITEERLSNLSACINPIVIRETWLNLLECRKELLESELDKYAEESDAVHPSIVKRTLETFASTFDLIETMHSQTSAAQDTRDLIMVLVRKQLADI